MLTCYIPAMQTKGKAIIAFLYAVAVVAVPLFAEGHQPTATEWVSIAIAAVTALGVYITPLIRQAPWTKSAIGAVLAGLNVLVTVIDGGITGNEYLTVAFSVIAALGITLAPAESHNGAAVGWGSDSRTLTA